MAALESQQSQQLDDKNHLVRTTNPGTNSQHISNTLLAHEVTDNKFESIDFEECFKDSPKFRQSLKDNLAYIDNLESCMSKTIKQINSYIETGRDHLKSHQDFITSMKVLKNNLTSGDRREKQISAHINTLLGALEEIVRLNEIVMDQSVRTIGSSLSRFINDDLAKIREARKSFDKINHEYDQALIRYSQPVKKQQDDTENYLIATSTAFTHTSLDLSIQLTTLQSKKGLDILSSLLSFTKAHSTFFHQGFDLFEDFKPHMSEMDEFLENTLDEFETMTRSLPSKHLMVSNNKLRPLCFDDNAQQVHLEGYLFKRASNGFKVWNRRWFILKDHKLLYQKRGDTQPTVMEDDIRLLTVRSVDRADNERRFCFEVLSPHKSHILQADSESACKTWISAIQAGINAAYHDTEYKSFPKSTSSNELATSSGAGTQVTSSWSSGFSFKALQQQATSKFNSITTSSSDTKDTTTHNKTKDLKIGPQRHDSTTSGDENECDTKFTKIDEYGRSYVPLNVAEDEGAGDDESPEEDLSSCQVTYPSASDCESKDATGNEESAPVKPQRAYMIILAMPGNDSCADCGAAQPKWASINLGITLCIECAGIHRSLGVHLSKVRSLTLDLEVWSPEIVQLMLSLGNLSVNSAYLACWPRGKKLPISSDSTREERENWIKSKYLLKSFMQPADAASDSDKNEGAKSKDDRSAEERKISAIRESDDGKERRKDLGDASSNEVLREECSKET